MPSSAWPSTPASSRSTRSSHATTRARAWVWGLARLAVRVFYRVERLGDALPDGALLLVANHPNALLDPAIVEATAGRPVRFLAKSTLFRGHPLGFLIRRSGAIPVYRRMDAGVDTTRNREMFSAVETALEHDDAVCLFPEGISHDRGRLEPLKTGAARMALESTSHGHPVSIVAVGLNFEHLVAFRSRATAVFGQPFGCDDLVESYGTDPKAAVNELTGRIGEHLRRLMIEADPRRDLPVVTRVDRLYASARGAARGPEARIARRRLIAKGIEHLRAHDPDRLEQLLSWVREYDANLTRFGLREQDVDQRFPVGETWRWAARELLLALVLGPIAAVSVLVFALPYWLSGRLSRLAPDLPSRATWKVAAGVVTYGIWVGVLAGLVAVGAGIGTGIAFATGLTILAFAGLVAFEREAAVGRTIGAFLAVRQAPLGALARLRRQRAAFADVLDQVAEWLRERQK